MGILVPFGVIYVFNTVMFLIILFSVLRHGSHKDGKESKLKKLAKKATITFILAIMFGFGWIFGFLASISGLPPFVSRFCEFTFIVVVASQGILLFLLHPFRSKDARQEWKKWWYYLTCRAKTHKEQLKLSISKARSSDHSGNTGDKKSSSTTNTSSGTATGTNRRISTDTLNPADIIGHNRRRSSGSPNAMDIAARFGYNPAARNRSNSADVGSKKKGNLLTIPGQGMSVSNSYVSGLSVVEETYFEDGASSYCGSPPPSDSLSDSSPQLPKKPRAKPSLRQMFVFDSRNDELLSFDDTNAEAFGNAIENEDSDLSFSADSSSHIFINEQAQSNESGDNFTWQTYEYDEELGTGEATIYYNFEDDSM